MNDKISEFLNEKKESAKAIYDQQKNITLINLGLFDKEYSPDNTESAEFPFPEWDSKTLTNKFYKKVPIDVSDEDYAEIKKYSYIEPSINPIAKALTVIAWIVFIGGFISGFVFGNEKYSYDNEFSIGAAFVCWAISLVSGTVFLGFAEIIKLLDAIKRK